MGNMHCPSEDAANLAAIAQDVCPFPNYTPSPLFVNMLSINSSLHLTNHYRAVQSSLNPQQLENFTKNLRTTFGKKGKVTLGGVGVVALSLAVLFDTLAKRAKGEWVPDSGPIPGLFVKDLRGYYPPHVYTISEYLRLVPHIANNPTRMIEETERCFRQLLTVEDDKRQRYDDITEVNIKLRELSLSRLRVHLRHITNSTVVVKIVKSVKAAKRRKGNSFVRGRVDENDVVFNLNCDPVAASKEFLAGVHKSDHTQRAFNRCQPLDGHLPKTWLHFIAKLVWLDVINDLITEQYEKSKLLTAQREDFDLKADALRKWAE